MLTTIEFRNLLGFFVFILTTAALATSQNNDEFERDLVYGFNALAPCGIAFDGDTLLTQDRHRVRRVIAGVDANPKAWPWMAYITQKDNDQVKNHICGGTLINSEWVVTAAHCLIHANNPEKYGVILGEHSVSHKSGNERERDVASIVRHRKYEHVTMTNDIALLKLSKPVVFTNYIRPVCLPGQKYPTDSNVIAMFEGKKAGYAGKECTVLGWGTTETGGKPDILQEAKVQVLPRILCASETKRRRAYGKLAVKKEMSKFCAAGKNGEDTCGSDSGGPLLCQDDLARYTLHGITSYGPMPCGHKLPAVYTKVSDYHNWIMENLK